MMLQSYVGRQRRTQLAVVVGEGSETAVLGAATDCNDQLADQLQPSW